MNNWNEYRLGDIAILKYGKLPPKRVDEGKFPIWSGYRYLGYSPIFNCTKNTPIVVARGVGGTGDVKLAKEDCYLTNLSISVSFTKDVCNPKYFTYFYAVKNLRYLDSGSAQSQITIDALSNVRLMLPPLAEQKKIASILSSLDDKIETNRHICAKLEELAQTLFKSWFIDFEPFKNGKFVESELGMIPEGWKVNSLTDIADFQNGLAMQKYPPLSEDDSIPVLKIKELGQSYCDDNSDRCTKNIKSEVIVHDGDVVFSWSGTLMVDLWCGGICGLNQHLFKVTSSQYPKWFYLMWTKHHLAEFIRIAKDKAVTMGHIKRGDLDKAFVLIPDDSTFERISPLMNVIIDKIISLRLESARLATLRDTLLPKLMSGQITL
jgi:type I restriction enzyme S subunit